MQTQKPQKLIGKKYVRGKPYYKVKWEGQSKDKATWESPPRLKDYKAMVNQYEVKNWGVPLDIKFFEQDLYLTKCFASNVKSSNKKSLKMQKRIKKAKIQQSDHSLSQEQQIGSENENNKDEKNESVIKSGVVIDVDDHCEGEKNSNLVDKSEMVKGQSNSRVIETKQNSQACLIDMMSLDLRKKQERHKQTELEKSEKIVHQKSLVFTSQLFQTVGQVQCFSGETLNCLSNASKKFSLAHCVGVQILPYRPTKIIENIYHLTKLDSQNHLYLVQFQRKEMKKLNSTQLLEAYPKEFVQFLESKFKAKEII